MCLSRLNFGAPPLAIQKAEYRLSDYFPICKIGKFNFSNLARMNLGGNHDELMQNQSLPLLYSLPFSWRSLYLPLNKDPVW